MESPAPGETTACALGGACTLASAFGGFRSGLAAGFGSGFVRRAIGYHMLANVATLAAGTLLVLALSARTSRARSCEISWNSSMTLCEKGQV